ncbi:MAG: hypothetical protein U9R23_04565 [Candidatus Cloacimonadota bacterium]|nr:hypothetical protein [Candidatus Cloacimonadota bacterium]
MFKKVKILTRKSNNIYETVIVSFSSFFLTANYIMNYNNFEMIGTPSAIIVIYAGGLMKDLLACLIIMFIGAFMCAFPIIGLPLFIFLI